MTARPWLRHPPAVIRRPLACPTTGLHRYASKDLARAGIPLYSRIRFTPTQCQHCRGGWHLIEGDI